MFSIIIVLAMMLSIQNNAFSENWRDGFARISMLPQGVYEHQCFTANGFVYCAGGYGDNGPIDKVWYARINSDGYLGEWNETTSLPYSVSEHQCFTANGFVYFVGKTSVWYTSLNADGSIDNWKETISLPYSYAISGHQCFFANGFIYCVGGHLKYYGYTSSVYYSSLNSDGSINEWKTSTSLPNDADGHQCFTINDYIYCTDELSLWYTTQYADGSIGNWQKTTSLPHSVHNDQCFTANGFVYFTNSNFLYASLLNGDGSIGNWQEKASFPYSVSSHQCLAENNFFYCIGGYSSKQKNDVLMYFEPIITISTHPNKNNWYITNKCSFYLNDKLKTPHGYYYNIDNKQDTEVTAINSEYTTIRSINLTTGKPVEQGVHYLHFALADSHFMPQNSHHFKFKTYADPIDVTSPTHSNQSEWFDNPSFQIDFNNKNTNLTYRYVIDDYSDTIPSSSSAILDSINRVFVNQQPGIHYLHVQVFDELGTTGQTLHFRYNIYDSDEPKPAHLPVVTKINVDPTSVTKDGTISIEGTIEIK